MKLAIGLVVLTALAASAPARAHNVTATISPPAAAAVEDAGFTITVAGDVSALPNGTGYVDARIRPGTARPCAPTELADPGDAINFGPPGSGSVSGAFSLAGTYTADAPGEYRICAWIGDQFLASGPPVSATMTVRPPVLRIAATAPPSVAPGEPFEVAVDYEAEVPRYLTVLVVRDTRCPVTSRSLGAIFGQPGIVADNLEVSGPGSVAGTVRLARPGAYLVCGYLDKLFLEAQRRSSWSARRPSPSRGRSPGSAPAAASAAAATSPACARTTCPAPQRDRSHAAGEQDVPHPGASEATAASHAPGA